MGRPNRAAHRDRTRARSCLDENSDLNLTVRSSQPRDPLIKVYVAFALPRQLVWLLAGIAIGNLRLPDGLLDKLSLVIRELLSG
jgi:hypothetical protein